MLNMALPAPGNLQLHQMDATNASAQTADAPSGEESKIEVDGIQVAAQESHNDKSDWAQLEYSIATRTSPGNNHLKGFVTELVEHAAAVVYG